MMADSTLQFLILQNFTLPHCSELQDSVSQIAETYMNNSDILFFSDSVTIQQSNLFQCLNTALSKRYITFIVNSSFSAPPFTHTEITKPKNILLYLDGEDIESFILDLRRNPYWNARARILVVAKSAKDIRDWIEILWKKTWAVNLVVISLDDKYTYNTWFPYKHQECENVGQIVELEFSQLFPPKTSFQLEGCSLSAYFSLAPMVPFVENENSGVEPKIYHAIVKKLNLTVYNVRAFAAVHNYFAADGELVGTGKMLMDHTIELLFGNLLRGYLTWRVFDVVTSHSDDSISWFVPSPRPLNRSVGLYLAFSLELWLAFLFVTLLTLFFCMLFNKFTNVKVDNFLQTWSMTLNLGAPEPNSFSFRFFIMVIYTYSLHVTTAYQASLFMFLSSVSREKPITTIEEAADLPNIAVNILTALQNGVVNVTEHEVWNKLLRPGRFFYKLFPTDPVEMQKGFSMQLGPRRACAYYYQDKRLYDKFGYHMIALIPKPNLATAINFFMSPGHPLFDLFNLLTQWLVQGGLPEHWVDEYVDQRLKHQVLLQQQPFGVTNLEGAFLALILMLALSTIILLFELYYYAYLG